MGVLHVNVKHFNDPKQYLHEPARDLDLVFLLEKLTSAGRINTNLAHEITDLVDDLYTAVLEEAKICFLHSDVHAMNIMCTPDDELLALIDWGDAGWGDPTFDFRQIPFSAIPYVLEGYRELAPDLLGETFIQRFVWDKLADVLENSMANPAVTVPMDEYRQFLKSNQIT